MIHRRKEEERQITWVSGGGCATCNGAIYQGDEPNILMAGDQRGPLRSAEFDELVVSCLVTGWGVCKMV